MRLGRAVLWAAAALALLALGLVATGRVEPGPGGTVWVWGWW